MAAQDILQVCWTTKRPQISRQLAGAIEKSQTMRLTPG